MKNNRRTFIQYLFLACIVFSVVACGNKEGNSQEVIHNPVLPGFYPDPSICRVGDDFYMVNSTFSYFPGIPVFHSRDLTNWKQIGHVLNRPSQIDLEGLGVSQGIFAPTIRYNKGTFYLITTLVGKNGNFFVTAKDPSGPWSDPVWLPEIDGIDPSIFFDDNDSCYIVNNGPAPNNEPLYEGHRAIWIQQFDLNANKLVGERKIIVDGGSDIGKKPIWIEGPHIYKKEGSYFLCAAEGGTAEDHSQVVFKSKSVWGPWQSFSGNPILTQSTLPVDRPHPITCTGHADLVELPNGNWWAVFLGCQPYDPSNENYFNTGRETFMAPVDWTLGWPIIGEKDKALKREYPKPMLDEYAPEGYQALNGAFTVRDNFEKDTLSLIWNFLRVPTDDWYELENEKLVIECRPVPLTEAGNPSFIGRRQQHAFCSSTVSLNFQAQNPKEAAGLTVFQNENHFYGLLVSKSEGQDIVRFVKTEEVLAEMPIADEDFDGSIQLRITARGNSYDFDYSTIDGEWVSIAANMDATFLSTRTAGGFVGAYFGMYAFGDLGNQAAFEWFEYSGK
ncbi:glycoside hydrolase family 43 protein [Labilibacter marinus]|uniref:glycoside hydrolase family 43 protein n=1 Tax=Labilibacter marinus TaxID=1477105 RepID=UPI0018EA085D|nr:glycoside hydrolase family 43 protein [Labilibacter marinus]